MLILCDTAPILMLLRIAPEMFVDERYQCVTIHQVRDEIFRTTKFHDKYPWRNTFREKVICVSDEVSRDPDIRRYFDAITILIDNVTVNQVTESPFDLSRVDKVVLANALARGFRISTGDKDLEDFARQEFGGEFKGTISPLGVLNGWIEKALIHWSEELHCFMADWKVNNEHLQPKIEIARFNRLTRRGYPGL